MTDTKLQIPRRPPGPRILPEDAERARWVFQISPYFSNSPGTLAELQGLARETDSELFFQGIFGLALRERDRKDGAALALLEWLRGSAAAPEAIRQRAGRELDALLGRGAAGPRAEYWLRHLAGEATDPRTLLPMVGASLLGRVAALGMTGRLLGAEASWYSRGWIARGLAGVGGFATEATAFSAGLRLFHPPSPRSFSQDLLLTALNLGAFKGAALLAGHRWLAGSALAAPLAAFSGILAARGLERGLGLVPDSQDATLLTDALGTYLTLSMGQHLATRLLGPRYAALQEAPAMRIRDVPAVPGLAALRWRTARAHGGPREGAQFPQAMMSKALDLGDSEALPPSGSGGYGAVLRLPRVVRSGSGRSFPFELLDAPEAEGLWGSEGGGMVGMRIPIAEREGRLVAIQVERLEKNLLGDPITPEGVTKFHFSVLEGEARGKVFSYFDRQGVTLYFIDLEESLITGGPPMRAGAGSIVMTWLAEQARSQGKNFNVTRITSEQTVKILKRQGLIDPERSWVEACTRLNPEGYDEEYRVDARFSLSDAAEWSRHRHNADFFNIYERKYPKR
ncbi:MAG: hypothetical protein U1F66_07585 [bacterium]